MSYRLYINYDCHGPGAKHEPISFEAWQAAVLRTNGVRLYIGQPRTKTNLKIDRPVGVPEAGEAAEVYIADQGDWRLAFQWRRGTISFLALPHPGNKLDPVWVAAVSLAHHLGAIIRGESGELYDLGTGIVRFRE